MRRAPVALAITFVALAVVLAAVFLRPAQDVAAPSPSPSATPSASLSPSATASPTPTAAASPSPSPSAQGAYMSKPYGYALTLTPPWHRAICGNIEIEPTGDRQAIEQFTSEDAMAEFIGHTGAFGRRVEVRVEVNPRGLSPMEFTGGRNPIGSGVSFGPDGVRSTTLAGRPAAEFGVEGGPIYGYLVGDGGRMYTVFYRTLRFERAPDAAAAMLPIVRSFRFLSAAEQDALPEPTPVPATGPTAQSLAASLKTAFEAKDTAALERLLGPCVNSGVQDGGGSLMTRERYVADLRKQFATGLVVAVDTSQIREGTWTPGDVFVRSRWNAIPAGQADPPPSPGAGIINVELMLTPTTGGLYWRGTLVVRPD